MQGTSVMLIDWGRMAVNLELMMMENRQALPGNQFLE